ncbi:MAG: MFS transporter [bacterium]
MFWLLALAYLFVYFHRFALSVVAVELNNTFQTSAGLMGILGSVYFYSYALMQFPAGLLSDSLGPRKGVTIFLLLTSCGSILFGFSSSIKMAILARLMVGIGVSMVFIPTLKILSQWYKPSEFAFMAALLNAMGGLGILISAAPLALISEILGWRISFQLIGVITFILAMLVWIIVRDRPSDMGWPSIKTAEQKTEPIPLLEGAKQVITEKYFWPVALWFFFDCGVFFGFGALWSGPYLIHVYGMSSKEAGLILSMLAVGMIGGSPLLSFLSDKVLHSRKKVLMLSSAALTADMLVLFLLPNVLSKTALFLVFLLFSIFSSAIVAIGFSTVKELFPIEITGTSVGCVNIFPFLGGAIFQHFLGWILDLYPKTGINIYPLRAYSSLLLILTGTSLLALFCTFFMKETI